MHEFLRPGIADFSGVAIHPSLAGELVAKMLDVAMSAHADAFADAGSAKVRFCNTGRSATRYNSCLMLCSQ